MLNNSVIDIGEINEGHGLDKYTYPLRSKGTSGSIEDQPTRQRDGEMAQSNLVPAKRKSPFLPLMLQSVDEGRRGGEGQWDEGGPQCPWPPEVMLQHDDPGYSANFVLTTP